MIEPNDQALLEPYSTGLLSSTFWFWFSLKQWLKKIGGKKKANFTNRYESIGNYVYSISKRELEKVALGLNLEALAVKGMNDSYLEGVEFEDLTKNGPLLKKIKKDINHLDKISSRRPETYGLLVAIIFKVKPSEKCIELLKQLQFNVTMLQMNPYTNLS